MFMHESNQKVVTISQTIFVLLPEKLFKQQTEKFSLICKIDF